MRSKSREQIFIVTLRRGREWPLESYYVSGNDRAHAMAKAARIARAKLEHVVEAITG